MEATKAENFSKWIAPQKTADSYITGLHVSNSLAPGKLVEFIPQNGREVTWYMCGPTVYSHSHMGHARTYIGFDVIRKIMRDYFGYQTKLVMNITDIDDKIIIKANEEKKDFNEVASFWEKEFFDDMEQLNVEAPDVITRVREFVPEIITFTQKIIDNGYAYESNGSVYFDVPKYSADPNHVYRKLKPPSEKDAELAREGEGSLATEQDKRNPADFALWKASKAGEPSWDSPWGKGRPGWHIECSVMSSAFLPCPMDIHSGGEDLKFPHHDNEIAQSEAHYDCPQWINYFLHSGHLNIKGQKMAKSLKNFITIKDILKVMNGRHLRLLFLLHKYDSIMDYNGEASFEEASNKEKRYKEYFGNVKSVLRTNPITDNQIWDQRDRALQEYYYQTTREIHTYLCDNFNTPGVLKKLDDLISEVNAYINKPPIKYPLLNTIFSYTRFIFKVMGLEFDKNDESNNKDNVKVIDALTRFRDQVRTNAAVKKDLSQILKDCDEIRDEILPLLGIRLTDRAIGEPSLWKFDDPEVLLAERDKKVKEKAEKQAKAEQLQAEKLRKEAELQEKMKINPKEMYTSQTDKYTQFDEEGVPTHDHEGKPLSKSSQKNLKKLWDKQKELYEKYLASQEKK